MNPIKVKLKSIDNKIFEVPIDLLKKVKFISGIVEQASEEKKIILLREVESKDLERVLEYLNHYKNFEPKKIPKPFPERTDDAFLRKILNDEWTFNFLKKMNLEETISFVNCANYLKIKGLIRILAAKLAHEMCNCDVEEARRKFDLDKEDNTDDEIGLISNV